MGKNKSSKVIIDEYDKKYGAIPLDHDEILDFLKSNYKKINMNHVNEMIESIQSIPWETKKYIVPVIPKPAARPRAAFETKHFYVPGSSTNKSLMKKIIGIEDELIMARANIAIDFFQPTPCYKMNQDEIYVAELGFIRPVIDPDVDNMLKAYLDALQGVVLAEDNIVTGVIGEKFFSVKPRLEITISYMAQPDSHYTERVLMNRMKRLIEKGMV